MGKGENPGYQHFLLSARYLQNLSFLEVLKVGIVWEKVEWPFPLGKHEIRTLSFQGGFDQNKHHKN